MRVIIDTNIFVSGILSPNNAPALIVKAVFEGRITAIFSQVTFIELKEVLLKPRLQSYFDKRKIDLQVFLNTLQLIVEMVEPVPCNLAIRDKKDQPFVELAATLPSPLFLITGDKDFTEEYHYEVKVISASAFAHRLKI